jgi:hypothetical protein
MATDTAHPHSPAIARRLGPGVYRAECVEPINPEDQPCGWLGDLREGPWWDARRAAEDDADQHAGRAPRPASAGPTPTRPVRIPDRLWLPLVQVADEEGISASEVLRQAIEADPRIATILAGQMASAS